MPACGKSTLGVVAAKMLCMDFLDLDLLLQRQIGTSLSKYIEDFGTADFLEAEADAIFSLDVENTIISTGGSAVLTERGAKKLSELGTMVYIRAPFELIEMRIGDIEKRGVAREEGQTLRDIYDSRCPIYEKYADIIVDVKGESIADTCRQLVKRLED